MENRVKNYAISQQHFVAGMSAFYEITNYLDDKHWEFIAECSEWGETRLSIMRFPSNILIAPGMTELYPAVVHVWLIGLFIKGS